MKDTISRVRSCFPMERARAATMKGQILLFNGKSKGGHYEGLAHNSFSEVLQSTFMSWPTQARKQWSYTMSKDIRKLHLVWNIAVILDTGWVPRGWEYLLPVYKEQWWIVCFWSNSKGCFWHTKHTWTHFQKGLHSFNYALGHLLQWERISHSSEYWPQINYVAASMQSQLDTSWIVLTLRCTVGFRLPEMRSWIVGSLPNQTDVRS